MITAAVACGGTHPTTGAAAGTATAAATHSATAAPLSCKQQYKAWKNGAAKPVGNKLKTELTAIQTAGRERRYPGPAGRAENSRGDCSPAAAIPGACVRGSARLLEEDLGPHPGRRGQRGRRHRPDRADPRRSAAEGRPGAGEKVGPGTQAHYLTASGTHSTGKRRQVGASPALSAFPRSRLVSPASRPRPAGTAARPTGPAAHPVFRGLPGRHQGLTSMAWGLPRRHCQEPMPQPSEWRRSWRSTRKASGRS